jgi:hypothetical protein
MISLQDFKKALGDQVEELSEEEILKLRDQQDKMAEFFFSAWKEEINQNSVKI